MPNVMSDSVVHPQQEKPASHSRRGQSFVEFALVLPMLLVLLLGIADFGRVFQAGIALEAAARNAAEVGAIQRLRDGPPDLVADPTYYADLHAVISAKACEEMEVIPPPRDSVAGVDCPQLSAIRVCVHDGDDADCGVPTYRYDNPVPPECTDIFNAAPAPWTSVAGDEITSHRVEVQVCYQFTTLFNLNLSLPMNTGLSLGDIYLQRTRSFVVDCPPGEVLADTC